MNLVSQSFEKMEITERSSWFQCSASSHSKDLQWKRAALLGDYGHSVELPGEDAVSLQYFAYRCYCAERCAEYFILLMCGIERSVSDNDDLLFFE